MRIDEITSNVKYRKNEQFQSLTIFWESSEYCKFVNFWIWWLTQFKNFVIFENYQIFIVEIFFNL